MLQLAIWDHNHSGETRCDVCGAMFEEHCCAVALCEGIPYYAGRNAPENAILTDICPDCLEAGNERAAQRMSARAARWSEDASARATLADAVRTMPRENWLTRRELEMHAQEIETQMRALWGD